MKSKLFGGLIILLGTILVFVVGYAKPSLGNPVEAYQVYLNGAKIGVIDSEDKLLQLIDNKQSELKEKYSVDKVYPPAGLDIEKVYTYDDKVEKVDDIYKKIKDIEPFTIEGYTVTITYTEKKIINDEEIIEPGEPVYIYMMDKGLIKDALYNTAAAFIGRETLDKYNQGIEEKITDLGSILTSVFFEESITVKKDLISTEEYIFKDVDTLSKYLLFGTLDDHKTYVTKIGDDLETIAEANQLNIEELLIANPQYVASNVLLTPNEKVNVSLIQPLVSIIYNKTVVSDVDVAYKTTTIKDNLKTTKYKEVTQKGVPGVTRMTQKIKYKNGEVQSYDITKREVIKTPVDEIVTVGTKTYGINWSEDPPNDDSEWGWPTITPYYICSGFGWRWGRMHNGIDIIVPKGMGTNIRAIKSGEVYRINRNKSLREGLSVYVYHNNGYSTAYMHLSKILVKEGDKVKEGDIVGLMGATGVVTGTHLHLALYEGKPYQPGYKPVDPCKVIYKC